MKKICLITGSRAEYGLQRNLILKLKKSKKFKLFLIVTASHLSYEYGYTINEIKKDRVKIYKKVETLLSSNTPIGISKTFGLGIISFAELLDEIKPDILVLTGDRYEILSAAAASLFQNIPIAHIHGGEKTIGSYDDSIRHSITKMSNFHFVANDTYRKRVLQLGENPKNIYVVGGLGIDNIKNNNFISKKSIEKLLKIKFNEKNILVTYHPETTGVNNNLNDFKILLSALENFKNTNIYFTMPNADNDSKELILAIKNFKIKNKNVFYFKSLGQRMYFSILKHIDCVVGNSSSGISEVPTFKKPTINIGNRQTGRIFATSIINVRANKNEIKKAFSKINSKSFNKIIQKTINPYGKFGASKKILSILEKINFKKSSKEFFDI